MPQSTVNIYSLVPRTRQHSTLDSMTTTNREVVGLDPTENGSFLPKNTSYHE